MVQNPIEPYLSDSRLLLALAVWREARGESIEAKRGVVAVIHNRCQMAPREGFRADVSGNVLKPWAFSSFNVGDPNADKYPGDTEPAWLDSLAAVDAGGADLTDGAVFYHDNSLECAPHAWGPVTQSAEIGRLRFYRIGAV